MDPQFAFSLDLPPSNSRKLLRVLHDQLRAAILDGRLKPGLRLPTTRAFAACYGVSRNTAVAVYELLLSEGYLATRRKAGTFVALVLPGSAARAATWDSDRSGDIRLNTPWRQAPLLSCVPTKVEVRHDFRFGIPDHRFFRGDIWHRLSGRALRALSSAPAVYCDARGRPALRDAIARHVAFTRGVACQPDDVVVTAGAQQAFDLLARILVTPGYTVVAVEDPGYPAIRAAFAMAGARIERVPVDEEGLIVERLPADARVICVTPSHQFPLGTAMSARRRAELLEFARLHGAAIVEDDYDGEFRFDGRPLDALQTLDRSESVFYVGTFSKSLFPALRMGFVVPPQWAHAALVVARQYAEYHPAVLPQDTLAAFIAEGHLMRHVWKMREIYGRRRRVLLESLQFEFGERLQPIATQAGLHISAFAHGVGEDIGNVVHRAREAGTCVEWLGAYSQEPTVQRGMGFGFGGVNEEGIVAGLAALRKLWPDA